MLWIAKSLELIGGVLAIGDVVQWSHELKQRAGHGMLLYQRDGMTMLREDENQTQRVLKAKRTVFGVDGDGIGGGLRRSGKRRGGHCREKFPADHGTESNAELLQKKGQGQGRGNTARRAVLSKQRQLKSGGRVKAVQQVVQPNPYRGGGIIQKGHDGTTGNLKLLGEIAYALCSVVTVGHIDNR